MTSLVSAAPTKPLTGLLRLLEPVAVRRGPRLDPPPLMGLLATPPTAVAATNSPPRELISAGKHSRLGRTPDAGKTWAGEVNE